MQDLSAHPLATFLAGAQLTAESPLGFSCRGCGHLCCVDNEVFLTPPEAARVTWFLRRRPALEARLREAGIAWGVLFIGESTGLPNLKLNRLPVDARQPAGRSYCVFLSPISADRGVGPRPTGLYGCGIHSARPGACRLFPVGRVDLRGADHPDQTRYGIVARCPGFEAAPAGEPLPPGYRPPDPLQTVGDWVATQLDPQQEVERSSYLTEVIPALRAAGLHAPTADSPDGRLDDEAALNLGYDRLFNPPAPPDDPREDHAVLMEWMETLTSDIGTRNGA